MSSLSFYKYKERLDIDEQKKTKPKVNENKYKEMTEIVYQDFNKFQLFG